MLNRENVLKNNYIKDCNGFTFQELPNVYKINLRGNSHDKDFATNIEKILGGLLPTEPNTSHRNSTLKIIWLGPNEWLIEIHKTKDFEKIILDLTNSLNSNNTAFTDITENKIILK